MRAPMICLLALLATSQPSRAITGHARDGSPQSAHVVMILARSGTRASFCSGVVVGPRAVLTAAHCVRTVETTRVHFKRADGAPVLLTIARIDRHPEYRAEAVARRLRSVDLAIVTTTDDLPAVFSPIAIAVNGAEVGDTVTIAGFGLSREGAAQTSGELREADVSVRQPRSDLLLWLTGSGGACTGDSGGPVSSADGALVGIVAYAEGSGGARCGALTQAIRIAPYREWIESVRQP